MELNGFILECEKENKYLKKDVEYYKNKSIRLGAKLKKQKEIIDKAVEYIKENVYENENGCGGYWWEITSRDELLSILEDKEV